MASEQVVVHDVSYRGDFTACHSFAMLSAYFSDELSLDLGLLEALTTVPVGLVSVAGDPNRVLNTWCDPDVGLDRACAALGLRNEVRSWPAGTEAGEPLDVLRRWVGQGPVVIGPLNMDGLPYLFERQLYKACDHFLVVWGVDQHGWWISDNERSVAEVLREVDLVDAWRADRIPEGRGAFIMRRVLTDARPALSTEGLRRVLAWSQENLRAADAAPRGGAAAYQAVARDILDGPTASQRRSLTYALPTRMQRLYHQQRLLMEFTNHPELGIRESAELERLITRECSAVAMVLADVIAGRSSSFEEPCIIHREVTARWCAMETAGGLRI